MSIVFTDNVPLLDGVSGAGVHTSDAYDISKRQQGIIQFIAAGGTTSFSIDGSNDKTNWVTGIAFLDAQATATSTSVTSKSVASASAAAILKMGFQFIRVVANITNGTASAILQDGG